MSDVATPRVPAVPAVPTASGSGRTLSLVIRVVIAAAVIGGFVWYLKFRHPDGAPAVAGQGRQGSADGGGSRRGGGGNDARVVPVQTAIAQRKDLPIWLEGLGTVAAFQQVVVRTQVDGKLDKVLFTEGQPVKKGEVIAQIDPRPFAVLLHQAQGALARDKAQLDTNQANLVRYQGLAAQKLVAEQQVEEIAGTVGQFAGAVKIDQAQIESAQLQLDYATVRAPLDGIAGVRQIDAGNIVHQSDANGLVVITAIEPAAVLFTVQQDTLPKVAAALAHGDVKVEIYSRDRSMKIGEGKLAVLDNQINQSTATLRLKALVANPDRVLWPNALVVARMLVETRTGALVIPAVAIQQGPQGTYVYVVGADKTAQMKPVVVGLTTGDVAVIDKGLDGGEQLVIEGANQLRPGGKVEPVQPGAGSGAGSGAPGDGTKEPGKHGKGSGGGSGAGHRGSAASPTASSEAPAAP